MNQNARLVDALPSLSQILFERAILPFPTRALQQRQKDLAPIVNRGENAGNFQIVAVWAIINLELVRTVAAFYQQSRGFFASYFSMMDPRDRITVGPRSRTLSLSLFHSSQLVVILVTADPDPFDCFAKRLANGAMMITDAN